MEVSPRLANDTQGTVEAAKWLHKVVNRANVYIKIPATAECVPSIREVISNGISVNVTVSDGIHLASVFSIYSEIIVVNSLFYTFCLFNCLQHCHGEIVYNGTAVICFLLIRNSFLLLQLIFSIARYEAVIDAYLDGLEASGLSDLSRVTSVASFFVSRVDSLVDKMLEKIGTPEALALRGKVNTIRITCAS